MSTAYQAATQQHRKKTIILFLLFHITCSALAQVDASLETLRNVVPPAPNASAIGRFGEWPVSLYTGVPNISVPVYELKGRSLSIPISLNYHASGIRIGDIASWVGLGWALDAGGLITRSVKGLPDEDSYFTESALYTDPNNFCSTAVNSTDGSTQTHRVQSAKNNMDSQQDIYSFSAMGKSYRLLLKADGTFVTMPYSKMKISTPFKANYGNESLTAWTVTLEDGTVLVFGGSSGYVEWNNNTSFGPTAGVIPFVASWYLKSVTSTTGETINFTYSTTTVTQGAHMTESDFIDYGTSTNSLCTRIVNTTTNSHKQVQQVEQRSVKTIESDLARLDFITDSPRLDLQGGVSLREIKVFSKLANQYIDDYKFSYAYSLAVAGSTTTPSTDTSYTFRRLRLAALTRRSPDSTLTQRWAFDYNSQNLPGRETYAQDHWGYFNGAMGNTTLLPTVPLSIPSGTGSITRSDQYTNGFMPSSHVIGGKRSPDETYMQAEMLKKITYPTGGYTLFNYEGNGYTASSKTYGSDSTVGLLMNLTNTTSPYYSSKTYSFTLAKPEYVQLIVSTATVSSSILSDMSSAYVTASILDSAGVQIAERRTAGTTWLNLFQAGTYTFKVFTNVPSDEFINSGDQVYMNASIVYQPYHGTASVKQLVGGLRIKSILSYTDSSSAPAAPRYFIYDSILVINPVDEINDYVLVQSKSTQPTSNDPYCTYTHTTRNASTKFALGSIQGGTAGYAQVTTLHGANGENGKTVSHFNSVPDASLTTSLSYPYPPSESRDWRRGLLLQETNYDASQHKITETANAYSFILKNVVTNFAAGYSSIVAPLWCTDTYQYCGISTACYNISTEQVQHTASSSTAYANNGLDSVVTATAYFYDDSSNMLPTRTLSFNSKGDSVLTYSRTALEKTAINSSISLTAQASTALDSMVARNMISQNIESEQYVKSTLMSKSLMNYKVEPNGWVQTDNVIVQIASNTPETRVQFAGYDAYGNIRQQQKYNDIPNSYIWDYKNQYPVASCTNSDTTSIAYTGFEADGTGGWTIGSGTLYTSTSLEGSNSYLLNSGAVISRSGLSSGNTYIVSYWTRNGSPFTVTGSTATTTGKSISIGGGTWTLYEHKVTGQSTISVGGNAAGYIDCLRLYPVDAQMTSYSYTPLVGVTSQCSADNKLIYYIYDGLNRLKLVKDQDGNILKTIDYHYQGQ